MAKPVAEGRPSRSNTLPIRLYLIEMDELVTSRKWAPRLHCVLYNLTEELAT